MMKSKYIPSFIYKSGHLNTILPTMFREVEGVFFERERIDTADGDYLDLDWSKVSSCNLAIISHGLEGNSGRAYVKGMVKSLNSIGVDCLAWNFRTCGGEMNKTLRMYHSGATDDLKRVVDYSISEKKYKKIVLIGFSMGGNLSLKYLGEEGRLVHKEIKGAVVFSVPCDLNDSSKELTKITRKLYMKRFLIKLKKKLEIKEKMFPGKISTENYNQIKSFKDFDNKYTAPIHGFKNAEDYWEKSSSIKFLKDIAVETYIINAKDDPFLGKKCYPIKEVENNDFLTLIVPKYGGHVGFVRRNLKDSCWSELKAAELSKKLLNLC